MPTYEAYLDTDEWKERRRAVLARCNDICERCGKYPAKQIHHKTYKHLFNEPLEDLEGLCGRCHRKHHGLEEEGWIWTAELDCVVCPSMVAEFFQLRKTRRTICIGCGHSTKEYLGRPPKRHRKPRTEGVPCPECGKLLASDYSVGQHMRAKHG